MEIEQCSVLFIKSGSRDETQIKALRSLGFRVVEADDLTNPVRLEKELYEAFLRRGVDLSGRVVGTLRPLPHRAR